MLIERVCEICGIKFAMEGSLTELMDPARYVKCPSCVTYPRGAKVVRRTPMEQGKSETKGSLFSNSFNYTKPDLIEINCEVCGSITTMNYEDYEVAVHFDRNITCVRCNHLRNDPNFRVAKHRVITEIFVER